MFKDRLKNYRKKLSIDNGKMISQAALSKELGISRQLLNSLETGYKSPSDDVIERLVEHSGFNKDYWLNGNGVDPVDEESFIRSRVNFKCLLTAVDSLHDSNLLDLNENGDWNPEVESMLMSALKADIIHLKLKNMINK